MQELSDRLTHLCDIDRFPPTWEGTTDASGTGMGGVCKDPEGQWFVWRSPFSMDTQARLVSDTNPKGDVTINDLELSALLVQVHIFSPKIHTLSHIYTAVDNTVAQGWTKYGSVSSATVIGPILRDIALMTRTHNIYSSARSITGAKNTMADATSRLIHLPDKMFLQHFALTFPQKKPWWLLTLPPGCRWHLTSMLQIKRCHMVFQPPSSKKTPLSGANGASSANGWESHPTSKVWGYRPFPPDLRRVRARRPSVRQKDPSQ